MKLSSFLDLVVLRKTLNDLTKEENRQAANVIGELLGIGHFVAGRHIVQVLGQHPEKGDWCVNLIQRVDVGMKDVDLPT